MLVPSQKTTVAFGVPTKLMILVAPEQIVANCAENATLGKGFMVTVVSWFIIGWVQIKDPVVVIFSNL